MKKKKKSNGLNGPNARNDRGGGAKLKNDAWMVLVIFPNKRE